jgi:hypothetical protein
VVFLCNRIFSWGLTFSLRFWSLLFGLIVLLNFLSDFLDRGFRSWSCNSLGYQGNNWCCFRDLWFFNLHLGNFNLFLWREFRLVLLYRLLSLPWLLRQPFLNVFRLPTLLFTHLFILGNTCRSRLFWWAFWCSDRFCLLRWPHVFDLWLQVRSWRCGYLLDVLFDRLRCFFGQHSFDWNRIAPLEETSSILDCLADRSTHSPRSLLA